MLPGQLALVRRLASGPRQPSWFSKPLDKVERWLRASYPKAHSVHRTVVEGGKQCFADLKTYARVSSAIRRGRPLEEFTRHELEIYVLTPADVEKLLVILVVIALPMTIFLMAIAIAFCPRLLLTRHFWTLQQTETFRSVILKKRRLLHYGRIAQSLAAVVAGRGDGGSEFCLALKNGPVSVRRLEDYARVIRSVDLDSLAPRHKFHLLRAHGLWTWGSDGASRLRLHSTVLAALDEKLRRERVDAMSLSDLKQSLYIRQFDIVQLSDDEERQLLKDWLMLTKRDSSAPLILHAPIVSQLEPDKNPTTR